MNAVRGRKSGAKRGKSGPSVGLLLGVFGGAILVLVALAVAVYFVVGKNGVPGGAPVLGIDLPNAKVTDANYQALQGGETLAQVEAVLGSGRPATAADIEAVYGKERQEIMDPYQQDRFTWEENIRRGLVLAWVHGPTRILAVFTQPPSAGGWLTTKLIRHANGSVSVLSGMNRPHSQPGGTTTTVVIPPRANPADGPPVASLAVADLLAEVAAAPRKYQGRKLTVSGTADAVDHNVVTFRTGGAALTATVSSPTAAVLGKKKGDAVVLTGIVRFYFQDSHTLMMDACTLDN